MPSSLTELTLWCFPDTSHKNEVGAKATCRIGAQHIKGIPAAKIDQALEACKTVADRCNNEAKQHSIEETHASLDELSALCEVDKVTGQEGHTLWLYQALLPVCWRSTVS